MSDAAVSMSAQFANSARSVTARFVWIDIIRTLAALGIAALHVVMPLTAARDSVPQWWWEIANFVRSATGCCVPLFVLISGSLLLDPTKQEGPLDFVRKRMSRVLVPLLFWTALYLLFRLVFGHLALAGIPQLLLTGTPYSHLWFLFVLPCLYAVTPALRDYIRGSTQAGRWYLVILILSIAACAQFLQSFFGTSLSDRSFLIRFVPYIGYYLAGYQLRFSHSERLGVPLLVGILSLSTLSTALGTSVLVSVLGPGRGEFLQDFFSPTIIVTSLAVFALSHRCLGASLAAPYTFSSLAVRLAPATLGIYVIHPLILEMFSRLHLDAVRFNPLLGIPLLSLAAFTISYLVTRMMISIPYLRRAVV